MEDIVVFEMVNGRVYIGKETSENEFEDVYQIEIMMDQQNPNGMQLALIPVLTPLSDPNYKKSWINTDHIIAKTKPSEEIKNIYVQKSSNLTLAKEMPNVNQSPFIVNN